jgi:hypothetical protein
MKKNILSIIIAMALIMPAVRANIAIPSIYQLYGAVAIILFIPVVIIESMAAYAAFRFINKKIGFLRLALAFFIANIISTVAGVFFSLVMHSYFNSSQLLIFLIPAYVLSSVIEVPAIYLFIRKKTNNPFAASTAISFLVNILSYIGITIIMIIN